MERSFKLTVVNAYAFNVTLIQWISNNEAFWNHRVGSNEMKLLLELGRGFKLDERPFKHYWTDELHEEHGCYQEEQICLEVNKVVFLFMEGFSFEISGRLLRNRGKKYLDHSGTNRYEVIMDNIVKRRKRLSHEINDMLYALIRQLF